MNNRVRWKPALLLFCACVLVGNAAIHAEEGPAIFPEDPLVLIGSERLELLIRALKTRVNIELLLGGGVPTGREGVVRYVVVEPKFHQETRFVRDVEVHYDVDGVLTDVKVPFRTKKMIVSPKVVGGELASQVPATVEETKIFLERSMKSLEQKNVPIQPESPK